jgi:hypothetical protein
MELGGKIKQFIMRFWRGTALPTAAELVAVAACPTTNPWLGATGATTPIIGNGGGGGGVANTARIRCILRDGNGQPLSGAILKVYIAARNTVVTSTIVGGVGTILSEFNGSNDAFNAPLGGVVVVQANTSGAIDMRTGAFADGPAAYVVALEHLGHIVTGTVTVTA